MNADSEDPKPVEPPKPPPESGGENVLGVLAALGGGGLVIAAIVLKGAAILKTIAVPFKIAFTFIAKFGAAILTGIKSVFTVIMTGLHIVADLSLDLFAGIFKLVRYLNGSAQTVKAGVEVAPAVPNAARDTSNALNDAFLNFYTVLIFAFIGCLIGVGLLVLFLVGKFLFARHCRVFVSFSHQNEGAAQALQTALSSKGIEVERIAYDPEANHQSIVQSVQEKLRNCKLMVCLPGQEQSFVESEVATATGQSKPVIFCLPETGTLPNTADKRFPVFNLALTTDQSFEPLSDFIYYVTGNYRTAVAQLKRAVLSPFILLTILNAFIALILLLVILAIVALITAYAGLDTGLRSAMLPQNEGFEVFLAHTSVFILVAAILITVLAYFLFVFLSLSKQHHAQQTARLRAKAAIFSREEWQNILPKGDTRFDHILQSMMAEAPQAHHEKANA